MKSFREFLNEDFTNENNQCFYFSEVHDKNSYREAEKLKAKDLASAKKEAKKNQAFYGTYLYIGTEINSKGFIEDPIAYYDAQKKKWVNLNEDFTDYKNSKLSESAESYLNKVKSIVDNDSTFKDFTSKIVNIGKEIYVELTPKNKFGSTIYPIIRFSGFSNSVNFNFENIKLLSWLDSEDVKRFNQRYNKLAKLYDYCEKIAKNNWEL